MASSSNANLNYYCHSDEQSVQKNAIDNLDPALQKKIHALQMLQMETIKLDVEFNRSFYELERKFQERHNEIFKRRFDIINGIYEPADIECQLLDSKLEKFVSAVGQDNPMGISDFWFKVLKNVSKVRSMIEDYDEPILKNLIDVRVICASVPNLHFQLKFIFSPNEFFQNSVLTKTYLMKCVLDEDDPFTFEGPEIYKSIGCEIMWNPGKNVTKRITQEKKSKIHLFKTDSFFNFFNPPELRIENFEEHDRIEKYLRNDFEVGHYLKDRVIPRAFLFYAGIIDDSISEDYDEDNETIKCHAENYQTSGTDDAN